MPSGHAAVAVNTTIEQKIARFLACGFDVIVDGLPRLLCQFKPDRPTRLLLPHGGAIDRIPLGATSSTRSATISQPRSLLSIARLNIARSRARPAICNRVRIDKTCFGRNGGFWPISLPFSRLSSRR